MVFDYDGNLWFATGGFRIYPERQQQGVLGYIAHSAIEAILNGEQTDLSKAVFVYELTPGEGAENGIAASKDGAVILTNKNCYLLRANNGVEAVWCTPYESVGAKVSGEGDKTTGGGLAWGGGCSPTLTPNLVMFTDNADPVNLLALDMKTGEVVAKTPVLDDLPDGYQVAIENSAIVYDDGAGTVSTIVCNWFGAGNAGLADPNNDSSIQSYANIYDQNWLMKGNAMIAPGVERVDTVKTDSGYEMKSIWTRNDLSDTAIMKLSTATGYIYGYVQDLTTGMWQYIILDFETGETVFTMDVSNKYGYNNMAIGMYTGNSGNALYCPTGYLELLRLQDRFVYLPELPYREVDLDQAARNVLAQDQFAQDGGEGTVANWRNTAAIRNVHPNTTVAFRMNNLSGSASDLTLYAYGPDGKLVKVAPELWSITDETGAAVTELTDGVLYELRVTVADGGDFDLSETEKEIKDNGSYILNANDLCTAPFIDLICKAGVDSLKIEGRAKTFYYVASVVSAYRRALDAFLADPYNDSFELPDDVIEELNRTSHRHYSPGFYFGKEQAQQTPSHTYVRDWDFIGTVDSWENGVAHCTQRGKFAVGDSIEILQPDGSVVKLTPAWIENADGERVDATPHPMMQYTIPCETPLMAYSLIRMQKQ